MRFSQIHIKGLGKKQRIGSLAMLVLLASFHIYNFLLYPKIYKYNDTFSIQDLYENLDDSLTSHFYGSNNDISTELKNILVENDTLIIQTFDPNKIDSTGLVNFQLPEKLIRNWVKYRNKGGRFYRCADMKKIYGMDPVTFDSLMSYCHCSLENKHEYDIHKSNTKRPRKNNWKDENSSLIVNINTADSLSLTRLKGIGPVLSKRIIKYRNRLGGFHKLSQLIEVYGVEDSVLNINKSILAVDGPIDKINVNKCDYREMIRHFYFDKSITNAILKYRIQHGSFDSIQELNKIQIINDSIYLRIISYLEI